MLQFLDDIVSGCCFSMGALLRPRTVDVHSTNSKLVK